MVGNSGMFLLKAWPWTDIYYSYQLYVACANNICMGVCIGFMWQGWWGCRSEETRTL